MGFAARCGVAAVGMALLSGCGTDPDSVDCLADVAFESVTYRSHNELADPPARTKPLGTGDLLDCDGEPIGDVEVAAAPGVDPAVAIVVTGPAEMAGMWVAEDLAPDEWPEQIRRTPDRQRPRAGGGA